MKKAGAVFDRTIGILALFSAALLTFVWLSVCTEVFMRYLLNRPLVWVVEIAEYSLFYITFLGAAWLLKEEGHVNLEVVLDRFNSRNQALITIITSILCAISCLTVTWWGAVATLDSFQRGIFDPRQLEISLGALLIIIPIGSFLLFIQFLRRIFIHLRRWRALPNKEQESQEEAIQLT